MRYNGQEKNERESNAKPIKTMKQIDNQPDIILPRVPGIRVYSALMNQLGTDAPTATVLQNTTGKEITWTRDSAGRYIGTTDESFIPERTALIIVNSFTNHLANILEWNYPDQVGIETTAINGTLTDGVLQNTFVEIRVYKEEEPE